MAGGKVEITGWQNGLSGIQVLTTSTTTAERFHYATPIQ
jgi:hypothetical protein